MYDDSFLHDREPLLIGWKYGAPPSAAQSMTVAEREFMLLPPELLFASDCFQARYVRIRETVAGYAVTSALPQYAARYSGERLDQFDLDVLLGCLRHTLQTPAGERMVRIPLRVLAQEVARGAGKAAQSRVRASLRRLESGSLHVGNSRYECLFSFLQQVLINRDEGLCLVAVHPMLLESLQGIQRLDLKIRDRNGLAADGLLRWLHALVHCGSQMCIPQGMLPSLGGLRSLTQNRLETAMLTLAGTGCRHYLGRTGTEELFLCLR